MKGIQTHNFSGDIYCTGSCKYNYHTIMTTPLTQSKSDEDTKHKHRCLTTLKWSAFGITPTRFVTRLTWWVPLVEQELLTLPEYQSSPLVLSGVRVTLSIVLCVCLYFFAWPLCCLFFTDILILITPLVSSNSSYPQSQIIYCKRNKTFPVYQLVFLKVNIFFEDELSLCINTISYCPFVELIQWEI